MSGPQPFALPCPPTPIMLYVGAGYDLSPLLSFAPGGPPYPIVPLSDQDHAHTDTLFVSPDKYTSFLFVDAKPRVTSAYMVSDFHEWTSIEARVRNILHYAQGSLSRWRTVPGAPDLLWFEGGGDPALVESRSHESAWVFHPPVLSDLPFTSPPIPHGSTLEPPSPQPLTTLLYLFNTLDLELVHAPLLEHVWPRVEALYVHGLRLHVRTGAGMVFGGHGVPNVTMDGGTDSRDSHAGVHKRAGVDLHGASPQTQLGTGLKRCYVIVGSWGTPLRKSWSARYKRSRIQEAERATVNMGMRHVDFVSEAWRRWKRESRTCAVLHPPLSVSSSSTSPTPSSASTTPLSVAISTSLLSQTNVPPSSPILFRRPRGRNSVVFHRDWNLDSEWDSDYDGDSEDECTDWDESQYEYSHEQGDDGGHLVESPLSSPPRISGPFHVRIPQLAWSPALRGGRGGYYVEKTVEESVAVWRARQGSYAGESEKDESASDEEFNYSEDGKRGGMMQKSMHSLYSLRSFFRIPTYTSPTSPPLDHPVEHMLIVPRSHKPPPHSQPRLRPRPPTPAPDSQETDSEDSTSETVIGMGHCERDKTGVVWECEHRRTRREIGEAYEMGMGSKKERVAFGFWRHGVRARRREEDFTGSVGVCDTLGTTRTRFKSMSMSISHTTRTTQVAPRHPRRKHSHNTIDIPSNTCKPLYTTSRHRQSRERRIDIADFLSTTSDPTACDTVGVLSSTDGFIPASICDSGPVMFSTDMARDTFAPHSAPPSTSSFYPTPASSTFWSSSPSLSPSSLSTTFPHSPHGPSDLFDNDANTGEQNHIVRSSKTRRSLILQLWRRKMSQQHDKEYRGSVDILRPGAISGLFWRKLPMTRPQDGLSPSSIPLSPASAHMPKSLGHHQAHKEAAAACCVVRGPQSHSRARATTTHRRFRFDPDVPPVPPLPSHFRGHHTHTRSLCDPVTHRGDTNWLHHSRIKRTRARASLTSSNTVSAPRPPSIVTSDLLDGPIISVARQSAECDETRNGG